jgi:hypothetical protein
MNEILNKHDLGNGKWEGPMRIIANHCEQRKYESIFDIGVRTHFMKGKIKIANNCERKKHVNVNLGPN